MLKDIKSTLKDSIIYGMGNLSTKLVGFILIPLYTKYLTVEDYAILAVLEITSQLIIAVFGFRISSAMLRFYWDKNYEDRQESLFFTALAFTAFLSIITSVLMVYYAQPLSQLLFDSTQFVYPLQLMAVSSALQIIVLVCMTLIRLKEKPVLYSVSNLLRLIVTLIITVYFIAYAQKNIEGIYEAQLIGYIVLFASFAHFIWQNTKMVIHRDILNELLSYGVPLILAEVSGAVFAITSRYCLNFLSTLHEVGTFSLGFKFANTLKVFIVSSIMLAISPMIFKKMNDPDSKRFYSKVMTYFSYGLMICILGVSLYGKEIIHLAAQNREYWPAADVIPLLSFSIFFSMLKDVSLTGLHITKQTKTISTVIGAMSVVNIGLNLLLILFWDSIGAALATLIAQVALFIIIYVMAQKSYPIPYEIGKVIKIIILGISLYLVSLLTIGMALYLRIVLKLLLVFLFPVILYYMNFYEKIELLRLKQSWHKWKNPLKWSENF